MSRGDKWIPMDKYLAQELPKINRSFSKIEAMFSYTLDQDKGKKGSVNGYAKQWGWSRNRAREFVKSIRTDYGHIKDTTRTHYGHPIHFIDKALWAIKDTLRTHYGHIKDTLEDTTSNPNNNPNPNQKITTRGKRFSPPEKKDVLEYCTKRKNSIDPERFVDHYTSNGWMVGKNKMKDWKAAVRTWEKNSNGKKNNNTAIKTKHDVNREIQEIGAAINERTKFNPYDIIEGRDSGGNADTTSLALPEQRPHKRDP